MKKSLLIMALLAVAAAACTPRAPAEGSKPADGHPTEKQK